MARVPGIGRAARPRPPAGARRWARSGSARRRTAAPSTPRHRTRRCARAGGSSAAGRRAARRRCRWSARSRSRCGRFRRAAGRGRCSSASQQTSGTTGSCRCDDVVVAALSSRRSASTSSRAERDIRDRAVGREGRPCAPARRSLGLFARAADARRGASAARARRRGHTGRGCGGRGPAPQARPQATRCGG